MNINISELNKSIEGTHITIEKHPTQDLYIYGYYKNPLSKEASVWNKHTALCRGLILNSKGEIIERAFDKFWTFRTHLSNNLIHLSENRILKLPNSKPKIFEKLDGTMGVLYWIDETPYIATQRSFSSMKAVKGSQLLQEKYLDVCKKLNKNYTYIFEIIYPENSLIIDYGDLQDLVLIGVIDKKTGHSIEQIDCYGFSIKKDLTSLYEGFNDLSELEKLNIPNMEGLVLEYENSLRVKIKFPWYKEIHSELQKLINAEFQKNESIEKLKKYYNVSEKPLASEDIKKSIDLGDLELSELKNKLNIYQIDKGVLAWIERHKESYIEDNKSFVNELFVNSIESKQVPDNRLWDWKNRYLEYYYD